MISLKKYLDAPSHKTIETDDGEEGLAVAAIRAFRSALREMGRATAEACPVVGPVLKQELGNVEDRLLDDASLDTIESAEKAVQAHLQEWMGRAVRHNRQKTDEVKGILITMARTAESVGQRDQRAANQIAEVTGRLQKIATLEDLSKIRSSIEESAAELRTSVERMAAEGKAAIEQLKTELTSYQTKLEEAEQIASSDSLTGLRSRMWMENYIERRMSTMQPFCIVIVDIDEFKRVNDEHGHPVGDELLKLFSVELKSAIRSGDIAGRWGGDEFIILLDCHLDEARAQTVRLKKWACGNYTLHGRSGPMKLTIDASIGLAERLPNEKLKDLLARADTDMYEQKAASRSIEARSSR